MNLERLRWGEWIAGIAGLNLALVIFRSWYKVSGGDGRVTAWDALESGRYLLIATAVLGVLLLVLIAAEQAEQMSFPPGGLVALVGLACTGYIAYRLATPPADEVDADIGLYLGLLSALGVAIGGLMSARDQGPGAVRTPLEADTSAMTPSGGGSTGPMTGPAGEPAGESWSPAPPAQSPGWSPAAPAASTGGWSPAAPAAPVPPATAAGAGFGGADRPVQAGDEVALTAGGAKFPAGTLARVVEVFGGGALVEVVAPDGVAERFEVPEQAYERVGGGAPPATGGESWEPAMPAPASGQGEDWGFSESAAVGAGAAGGAAGGAAIASNGDQEEAEKKPGFFKRLFGGGKSKEHEAETTESEAVDEAADAAPTETWDEPAPQAAEPEPAPFAEESVAEQAAPDPVPDPEPPAPDPVPDPEPAAPEPEVIASAPTPAVEPEPVAPDPEPEPPAPEPEPAAPVAPDPEAESEPIASAPEPPAPEPAAPESAPEAQSSAVDEPALGGAAAAGAAGAAASDEPAEEKPKPKRKRSSGSRKVPKEALDAGAGDQPKVGDEVQLKVGGGKYDAGTKGRVVDVFSAGVIVELSDDEGRTERLDLPFEAVGPADA